MLADWRKTNVTSNLKKKHPGNCRLISPSLIPRKVLKQIILETISWHVKDEKVIRSNQHGFIKEHLCLTNLINFCD